MQRFLISIVAFVALLFVMDRAVHFGLTMVRPSDYGTFLAAKQLYFEEDKHYDVVAVGDSHVADAFNTKVFEQATGMTAFNLGIYHSSPFEIYHVVQSIVDRDGLKPKYLIVGTNPVYFERPLSKGKYTPFIISDNELIANSDEGYDGAYFFNTVSEQYLFRSAFNLAIGRKYTPTRDIVEVHNGFLRFDNQLPGQNWEPEVEDIESRKPDQRAQVTYFARILDLAKSHGIVPVVIHPPIYERHFALLASTDAFRRFERSTDSIVAASGVATPGAEFERYQSQLRRENFLNPQHLNHSGSVIFTEHLAKWFRATIEAGEAPDTGIPPVEKEQGRN